ncbi:MAG TPA: dihydroorotate dehydrogenase, partial [Phycisphaerales bacterium]|nr:dihydroorotate dehydrogenase [Phycisphaerales bacterium]
VGIGTASFIEPDCAVKIVDGIKRYCAAHNVSDVNELVGSLEV